MSLKPGIQLNVPDHILYEDDVILVMNKPAGLMVEPDRNGYPNLLQQVKQYRKATLPEGEEVYAQHIHRLDRPVSGIILFAKQRSVLKNLSEQFAERRVKKYYEALTDHAPEVLSGTLRHWFRKEKKKAVLYEEPIPETEEVVLRYTTHNSIPGRTLWDIELHTGKFHQIRAQLAFAGCPVVGDGLYGSRVAYMENAIALHAGKLAFFHPVSGEEMVMVKENEFLSVV